MLFKEEFQKLSTMSCLRSYLTESVAVFAASDFQMVFLAIALAGSLCCSIMWKLFAFLSMKNSFSVKPAKRKRPKNLKSQRLFSRTKHSCSLGEELYFPSRRYPIERREQLNCLSFATGSNIQCALPSYNYANLHSQLLHLDHSYSGLSQCPKRIGFLGSQLVSLNLSNNKLSSLPDEIGCLLGLEELYIGQNQLRCLPETFRNLRRLKELDLQNNELKSLGFGLTALTCLKQLLVSNNSLTHLPEDFHLLQNLRHLDVSCNSLTWLPDSLCSIFCLTVLNISNNPITYMPEKINKLVRLTHLIASFCELVVLPRTICGCAQLVSVQLSRNRLKHLPDGIGWLFNLQFLSLDGNCLQYLPVTISSLRSCHIMVENNCFISPSLISSVVVDITRGLSSTAAPSDLVSRGTISLLEQAAICILRSDIKWQHENIPQTLKDILTNVRYCICCDRPLLLWQRMHISSHSLVSRTGQTTQVPLVQSTCPLQTRLAPCTFLNI